MVHPSAAVVVDSDTPIEDCILLMQKRNVGSVLVVGNSAEQNLVGIFTERDLLRVCIELKNGSYWRRPISQVMSTKLQVIELANIENASEIMNELGIRHLPVVMTEGKKQRLVGVVSMRDLFKKMVFPKTESKTITAKRKQKSISIVTKDSLFLKTIESGVPESQIKYTKIENMNIDGAVLNSSKSDVLVFDLDGIAVKQWLAILKLLNKKSTKPLIVLCFSQELIEPAANKILNKLKHTYGYIVFTKPIAIDAFFNRLFK